MKIKRFIFKKIDAFATEHSDGNPAGSIWLNTFNDITPDEMQEIASQLKGFVSEVGFICPTAEGEYALKFYSAKREVDFCGHATIAMLNELFKSNEKLTHTRKVKVITNSGVLEVENRITGENAVFITAPSPRYQLNVPGNQEIAAVLNINTEIIDKILPVQSIDAGLSTLIVPIISLDSTLNVTPDIDELNDFCIENSIDIVVIFTSKTSCPDNDFRVRVFAATFGYLEDPATGSGNSALGYYLLQNTMWNKDTIIIEQNSSMKNYNIVKLQKTQDGEGNERVIFGGGAIKRIEGEYFLTS
ncbi:MAG: PhzF family phenazine biosynthesis protein [Bacteroidetes bacterium]|nr:PhzF family phenazine biosynthesis protein [Bacteroidota bacterium]